MKVSVIVPVYNTEKYLEKCLYSLVNQTLEDIEILVVDDGATDSSYKIINRFKNEYSSKIIALKKENGGLSDARNFAIKHASGEYVGFVDSDDYVESNMFEDMYNIAVKEDLDLVECDFIWEDSKKNKIDFGKKYLSKEDYFIKGRVMACNKLFKARIINENKIAFPLGLRYEDIEFFYKYISYIKKSDVVNKPFYHYVQRKESIANSQNEKNNDIFIILRSIIEFYQGRNLYNEYKHCLEYLYIRFLLGSSFLRIVKVEDKVVRSTMLKKTWTELNNEFPNWRNNIILQKQKGMKNLYYKTVNETTYKIYSKIFR